MGPGGRLTPGSTKLRADIGTAQGCTKWGLIIGINLLPNRYFIPFPTKRRSRGSALHCSSAYREGFSWVVLGSCPPPPPRPPLFYPVLSNFLRSEYSVVGWGRVHSNSLPNSGPCISHGMKTKGREVCCILFSAGHRVAETIPVCQHSLRSSCG